MEEEGKDEWKDEGKEEGQVQLLTPYRTQCCTS